MCRTGLGPGRSVAARVDVQPECGDRHGMLERRSDGGHDALGVLQVGRDVLGTEEQILVLALVTSPPQSLKLSDRPGHVGDSFKGVDPNGSMRSWGHAR